MKATVVMPSFTPRVFKEECAHFGSEVVEVDGLIDSCGHYAQEFVEKEGGWNVSTLKEPYRLEGKKTMGFEIAEQYAWDPPDVILYPTGGGTGLIGIWKGMKELQRRGWISANALPRMVAVQSRDCAPVVEAFTGQDHEGKISGSTVPPGLAVPKAFGGDLILDVLRESGGTAIAVSEAAIRSALKMLRRAEGIFVASEAAAALAAVDPLYRAGQITPQDRVMLLLTGSGYKYL